ncbi:poly(3-hydroxyalkanoate) depolymerase [Kribbella capetownensis]|uniref:Poly(3-hydroxyalkanoate) depolymerase n=1 Tax=Kribbella capetownensis TaxID=1572659 RepID=A0A4R0K2F2_9ACTN|nr:poly(3-hydroxyalkanoate) depolymerase [Kribbella capetownensis]
MHSLTVAGQRIRYDIRPGNRRKTPLLLCCGIGAAFEVLQTVIDAMDPDREVIRFDVPGVGGSPVGLLPYPFPILAWIVERMLRQLGYDEVDVLGLSWGGALAQQLAVQHRRRVRRLVLVSTATGMLMVPGRPATLVRMVTPRRFRDPEYAAGVAGFLYGGSARRHATDIRTMFKNQAYAGSRRGYLFQLMAGAAWTSLPFLGLIQQPTLVLSGDDDPIIPIANARILATLIRHAELHLYHGGHVELVTEAPNLVPVITEYLSR